MKHRLALVLLSVLLAACGNLLPDSGKDQVTPWKSYAEAEAAFAKIIPNQTTLVQLKELGFDPDHVPNVSILSHADLLRRLQAIVAFEGSKLEPAIRKCVNAHDECYGIHVEQQSIARERVGNFFMDFLNFHRTTHVTGWQFDALILVSHNLVVYKSWSGKPNISEVEEERHPLGPLQGAGSSVR